MSADLDRERIAVLVHEVRSPVAALAAVAQAAGDAKADSGARNELVRLAVAACDAIERIVMDLAVASVRLAELDARVLVADAVASFRLRGAEVASETGDGTVVVLGDPVRLRQALDNLIANALAHGGCQEPVAVSVVEMGDRVAITVIDRGRGIAPADLQRIFEPGVRLDEESAGSGLGLPLARAIVAAHGGVVDVESVEGLGATFTILLPLSPVQPAT